MGPDGWVGYSFTFHTRSASHRPSGQVKRSGHCSPQRSHPRGPIDSRPSLAVASGSSLQVSRDAAGDKPHPGFRLHRAPDAFSREGGSDTRGRIGPRWPGGGGQGGGAEEGRRARTRRGEQGSTQLEGASARTQKGRATPSGPTLGRFHVLPPASCLLGADPGPARVSAHCPDGTVHGYVQCKVCDVLSALCDARPSLATGARQARSRSRCLPWLLPCASSGAIHGKSSTRLGSWAQGWLREPFHPVIRRTSRRRPSPVPSRYYPYHQLSLGTARNSDASKAKIGPCH